MAEMLQYLRPLMKPYIYPLLIGLVFVSWPIVGRYTGVNGGWIGSLVMSGTAIMALVMSVNDLQVQRPPTWAITLLFVLGLVNGWACIKYSHLASDSTLVVSTIAVTISIVMVCLAPIVDRVLNGSPITFQKIIGYACAAAAVWFLRGGEV